MRINNIWCRRSIDLAMATGHNISNARFIYVIICPLTNIETELLRYWSNEPNSPLRTNQKQYQIWILCWKRWSILMILKICFKIIALLVYCAQQLSIGTTFEWCAYAVAPHGAHLHFNESKSNNNSVCNQVFFCKYFPSFYFGFIAHLIRSEILSDWYHKLV